MNSVTTFAEAIALLGDLIGASHYKNGSAGVGLYTNSVVLTKDTALGDLTAPTYTGYAVSAITANGTAYTDDETDAASILSNGTITFKPTNNTNLPQTINGVYLKGNGGQLVAAANFDTPVTLTTSSDAIVVAVKGTVDPTGKVVIVFDLL
jgi:hypothetical protein